MAHAFRFGTNLSDNTHPMPVNKELQGGSQSEGWRFGLDNDGT